MSLFGKIKKVLTDYGFIMIISILGIAVLNFSFQKTCDDITFSMIGNTSVTALLKGALMQGNGRLLGNFFCYLIKYSLFTFIEKNGDLVRYSFSDNKNHRQQKYYCKHNDCSFNNLPLRYDFFASLRLEFGFSKLCFSCVFNTV